MSDLLNNQNQIVLSIENDKDIKKIAKFCYALSSVDRVKVMKALQNTSKSLSDLSLELKLPLSTLSRYIDSLQEAQIISINYLPSKKGHVKICSQVALGCNISLDSKQNETTNSSAKEITVELPVGVFSACKVSAPCGMLGKEDKIIPYDNPKLFFTPNRINAQCIWFDSGFVCYDFPIDVLNDHKCSEIHFSFEVCSEAIYYNNKWKSDITVSVNDMEVCEFTSPGDFGGRRGKNTPSYWPITSTQYGLLKKIIINKDGVSIDGLIVNKNVTFESLNLYNENLNSIRLKLEVKEDAIHKGGINIFGESFGDFDQAIVMTVK